MNHVHLTVNWLSLSQPNCIMSEAGTYLGRRFRLVCTLIELPSSCMLCKHQKAVLFGERIAYPAAAAASLSARLFICRLGALVTPGPAQPTPSRWWHIAIIHPTALQPSLLHVTPILHSDCPLKRDKTYPSPHNKLFVT